MGCPFVGVATRITIQGERVSIRICGAVPYERDEDPEDLAPPSVCFSEEDWRGCYHYQTMMKRKAFSRPPMVDAEGGIRMAWKPEELGDFEMEDATRTPAEVVWEEDEDLLNRRRAISLLRSYSLNHPLLQVITDTTTAASSGGGGIDWLKLIAGILAVIGAYLVALWFASLVWTFRDITSRTRDVIAITASMLLAIPPFMGLPLYMILRPKETLAEAYERSLEEEYLLQDIEENETCPTCRHKVHGDYMYCPNCRTRLRRECDGCHRAINLRWQACPFCGRATTDVMHTSRLERSRDGRGRTAAIVASTNIARSNGASTAAPTVRVSSNGTNGISNTANASTTNPNSGLLPDDADEAALRLA